MPSPTSNLTPKSPSLLIPVVILSLLLGGLAGGIAGYSVASRTTPTVLTNGTRAVALSVQEDSATVEVVKQAAPAVVTVVATKDVSQVQRAPRSPFDDFFGIPFSQPAPESSGQQEVGQAAGFIVGADGLIVTNKHVINDDQAEYTVILSDGRTFPATIVAKDPTNDVAVVRIAATELPTLSLGDSDKVVIGQTAIAIGNPLRFRGSVTKGIISGKSRTITASDGTGQAETLEDVFQTDAAINPGNSGGPLIDLAGQVIAMNTAVSQEGQLIGFAIPINVIKRDLASVSQYGKIVRPFLGVRYVLISESLAKQEDLPVTQGALIQAGENNQPAVQPDSPAAKAGLKENDIIAAVNGEAITAERSLAGLLSKYQPGDEVTLKVIQTDQTSELKVTLGERTE